MNSWILIHINGKIEKIKWAITIFALTVAAVHFIEPSLTIDSTTVILLIIAGIPWLSPILKSIELPGFGKIEFQDLNQVTQKAVKSGLISEDIVSDKIEKSITDNDVEVKSVYYSIFSEDPNLALAGLRIEIEKVLKDLASYYGIRNVERKSVRYLISSLEREAILTLEEKSALNDIIPLLNNAVHGAEVSREAAEWAIDIGPEILKSLEKKMKK